MSGSSRQRTCRSRLVSATRNDSYITCGIVKLLSFFTRFGRKCRQVPSCSCLRRGCCQNWAMDTRAGRLPSLTALRLWHHQWPRNMASTNPFVFIRQRSWKPCAKVRGFNVPGYIPLHLAMSKESSFRHDKYWIARGGSLRFDAFLMNIAPTQSRMAGGTYGWNPGCMRLWGAY